MSDIWSRAWCETQKIPNFAVKGEHFFKDICKGVSAELGQGQQVQQPGNLTHLD